MKKLFFILIAVISLYSCEKEDLLKTFSQNKVPILLRGDYVNLSTSPLSKGISTNSYFAFEIDQVKIDTFKTDAGRIPVTRIDTTYTHYAGAIFTELNNISVNPDNGYRYRIRCSIINEREDKLYIENGYLFEPFVAPRYGSYGTKAKVNNAFIYGEKKEVYAYNPAPYIYTIDNDTNFAARVNRYYGEIITDIIDDNSPVSLQMDRRNFGLHFLIAPPKEGILKVSQSYSSPEFEFTLDSESSSVDEEYVYALDLNNNHKTLDLKIKWTKKDGEVVDLSPGMTTFYNKTMTTIKVDVNDRVGNSDIEINYDSEMSQDEFVIK